MSGGDRVVVGRAWNFAGQLLESLALSLRDQESREATAQHEEGEDLHDVVEPWRFGRSFGSTLGSERTEDALSDYSANFS